MSEALLMTLTRLPPTGDAEMFLLSDGAGRERRFVVSSAQMAGNPDAVAYAIRRAVDEMKAAPR